MNATCYHTRNNTLYSDEGASFSQDCGEALSFAAWQALGQDGASVAAVTPPISQLIAMGAAKVLGGEALAAA